GSLTTPPCSAALWVMCARRMTMSREQIGRLVDAMVDKPNNRPVQPLNGRTILLFPAATPPREVPQDWQLVLQADSLVIAAAALVGLALGVGTCASRSQRQVGKLA
ncbi:MAG: carbonic anhydrase family protein, partial [Allorhizobium sp.]